MLVRDGERIPHLYGVPGDDPSPVVPEFEHGRRPEEEDPPRGGQQQEGQPPRQATPDQGLFTPFSAKYIKAPGWNGMGDPP